MSTGISKLLCQSKIYRCVLQWPYRAAMYEFACLSYVWHIGELYLTWEMFTMVLWDSW